MEFIMIFRIVSLCENQPEIMENFISWTKRISAYEKTTLHMRKLEIKLFWAASSVVPQIVKQLNISRSEIELDECMNYTFDMNFLIKALRE